MKTLLVFLLGFYACSGALVDRACGTDLSNLWLDVVAVVDVSNGMTTESLNSVAATLSTIFAYNTKIGTDPNNPRTTRVGLVTYSQKATVKADLDTFKSYDNFTDGVFADLTSVDQGGKSYLITGLEAAETMFGNTDGTPRGHYRKVIIVFASAYEGADEENPVPTAERLQTSGVTIITVAYVQTANVLNGLNLVATPHLNFTNANNTEVVSNTQSALLQANCFCGSLWEPFRDSFADRYSFKYGVCLQQVNIQANWKSAQISCRNRFKGAYLANEYSQKKHDFILNYVIDAGYTSPYQYHIGLNYNVNQWMWDQPQGYNQKSMTDGDWFNWIQGFPVSSSSKSSVMNSQTGMKTGWMNIPSYTQPANYVCEVTSCDTDNYCSASGL